VTLVDHANVRDQWARRKRQRAGLPEEYGQFIAGSASWSWFINPITFRGDAPCSDAAIKVIEEWLADLDAHAGKPIGWLIAEEFGALGERWHCHGLVAGVSHLHRKFWWAEAFRRFGRTKIAPFDPSRAGAFYAAKYAAKALGNIHFGGTLAGVELSRAMRKNGGPRSWADSLAKSSDPSHTHALVVSSASLPKEFFRLGLGRRRR
jgi:hypothetical protein